jgi:hypothetical protein
MNEASRTAGAAARCSKWGPANEVPAVKRRKYGGPAKKPPDQYGPVEQGVAAMVYVAPSAVVIAAL